jgi:hypothetical protein
MIHRGSCERFQSDPMQANREQSAPIVVSRPAQRNMIARLGTALFYVNHVGTTNGVGVEPMRFWKALLF